VVLSNTPISPIVKDDNQTGQMNEAKNYFNNPSDDINSLDFYPKPTIADAHINLSSFAKDISWNLDFNENAQDGKYYGAYSGKGQNPGWKLAFDIKKINKNISTVIDNVVTKMDIEIFPNPVIWNSTISIRIPFNDNITLRLLDIFGRELNTLYDGYMERGTHNFRVISKSVMLSNEMFYLTVNTSKSSQVFPIVLIK
jgi:hypothetical protein